MSWGDRYVDLVIVSITRQKVTLNECLTDIDVIRENVVMSDENQHQAQTVGVRYRTEAVFKITRVRCILLLQVLTLDDKTDLAALEGVIFSFNLVMKTSRKNVIINFEGSLVVSSVLPAVDGSLPSSST